MQLVLGFSGCAFVQVIEPEFLAIQAEAMTIPELEASLINPSFIWLFRVVFTELDADTPDTSTINITTEAIITVGKAKALLKFLYLFVT